MADIILFIVILLGIVLSVLLSAFYSGSEMALSACNKVRLENEAEEGRKASKRALNLAEKFDDTLSTILVGNNLVNILASTLTTVGVMVLCERILKVNGEWDWLGTLIVTVIVIIFGETVPKMICKKKSTQMAAKLSGGVTFSKIVFFPIAMLVTLIVKLITLPIKERKEENPEEEKTEELQSIIETAEDEGVLDADQKEIVSAAIDFQDTCASDAMTSRVDMEAIDITDSRENILNTVFTSTHSRLPVYEGSIDKIIGVVHLNHLYKALSENPDADLREVMMEPVFVYKTMKLPVVLNHLKKARQHLAIVTDEYSGTLGVITMEDVLEEIVGDIWDETDEVEEEIVERKTGELEIDGDMPIGDFLELAGVLEDTFDYESQTVGGFVTELKGDFPEVGEQFTYEGISIAVLEMEERRVVKLLVTLPEEEKKEE